MTTQERRDWIVRQVAEKFRTFGGDKVRDDWNPISAAMGGSPPKFALGVDVTDVVDLVLELAP